MVSYLVLKNKSEIEKVSQIMFLSQNIFCIMYHGVRLEPMILMRT